ncbi:MAG: DUF6106 family protein [Lachnospiraceae bacterium]|nr:DUF6106 family protein [Lachnospiraceae bacterium]
MNDISLEYRVHRQKTGRETLIRYALILGAVLLAYLGFFIHPLFIIALLAETVAAVIILPRLDVEIEYLFVAGELSIDRIFSKSTRKNAVDFKLDSMEFFAPEKSSGLDPFRTGSLQTADYTSLDPGADRYVMIIPWEGNRLWAVLEPGEKIASEIISRYPSRSARI